MVTSRDALQSEAPLESGVTGNSDRRSKVSDISTPQAGAAIGGGGTRRGNLSNITERCAGGIASATAINVGNKGGGMQICGHTTWVPRNRVSVLLVRVGQELQR